MDTQAAQDVDLRPEVDPAAMKGGTHPVTANRDAPSDDTGSGGVSSASDVGLLGPDMPTPAGGTTNVGAELGLGGAGGDTGDFGGGLTGGSMMGAGDGALGAGDISTGDTASGGAEGGAGGGDLGPSAIAGNLGAAGAGAGDADLGGIRGSSGVGIGSAGGLSTTGEGDAAAS